MQTTTHIDSENEAKMSGPFIFIATNRLKPGASQAERRRVPGLVDFIEGGEPRLLAFNEYRNADRTDVTVAQVHPDAASMEFHMDVVRERAASAYAETLDATTRIQAFGSPSDASAGDAARASEDGRAPRWTQDAPAIDRSASDHRSSSRGFGSTARLRELSPGLERGGPFRSIRRPVSLQL